MIDRERYDVALARHRRLYVADPSRSLLLLFCRVASLICAKSNAQAKCPPPTMSHCEYPSSWVLGSSGGSYFKRKQRTKQISSCTSALKGGGVFRSLCFTTPSPTVHKGPIKHFQMTHPVTSLAVSKFYRAILRFSTKKKFSASPVDGWWMLQTLVA